MPYILKPAFNRATTSMTRPITERLTMEMIIRSQMAGTAHDTKIFKSTLPARQCVVMVLQRVIAHTKLRRHNTNIPPHLIHYTLGALTHTLASAHARPAKHAAQHFWHTGIYSCKGRIEVLLYQSPRESRKDKIRRPSMSFS